VWNEKLDPGDPINPRFQALDPGFPTTQPGMVGRPKRVPENEVQLNPVFQPTYTFHSAMWELWSEYHQFSLDASAHQVVLNFSSVTHAEMLDVDALVKIRDLGWQRRRLDPGETQWCLDNPADHVEQFIIVLSNHAAEPGNFVEGDWTVTPKLEGCSTLSGDTLQYTLSGHSGAAGDPLWGTNQESLTLRVKLKSRPLNSPYSAEFLDAGSTYQVEYKSHTEQQSFDCVVVSDVTGGGGGVAPQPDTVVGGLTQAFDTNPDGEWILSISASVPVQLTSTIDYCVLGVQTSTSDGVVQLPRCDGTEVKDSDPARIFSFDCHFKSDTLSWSVVGSVTLNT
jgi:hypothetical protein